MKVSDIENYPGLQNMVTAVLDDMELTHQTLDAEYIVLRLSADSGILSCQIHTEDEDGWRCLAITVAAPSYVPKARFAEVSEWVIRRNYSLRVGAYHLDHGDGEVQYRINALLGDSLATPEIVQANLITALQMMDRAVPEVMAVAFGDQTVLQVITDADKIDADNDEAAASPLQ
ncbi:hypothetical protein C4901_02560 [Acidiferrobacter sp. SPIII_3]|jgi:hypothetical protein|uniref:YbjN domain-containing protein n=1 Tax=Acidiferrobacter sp. SPIII_3 TaxID=1281578 RepID=UPI000D72F920|nr:YbjN domain-containing protein [Acidiferrobacter sp. SPIII_3]AWP22370.1 hypothetical protein C4901_02560 [Acidiferrobacter sp. SPIII_3]